MSTRAFRVIAPSLLLIQVLTHFWSFGGRQWSELYLYNLVVFIAITVIVCAPRITDPLAKPFFAAAFILWLIGSLLSSAASYYSPIPASQLLANISYLLFYPCAVIALPRLINPSKDLSVLEIFDASIVGLGISTLGTSLVLNPVLPHFGGKLSETFFALAFPLSDLVLISLTIAAVLSHSSSPRNYYLIAGITVFTMTDFLYLWQHLRGTYSFGSLIDDGWLLALILIAESFWRKGNDDLRRTVINPVFIALAIFMSATLLALIAIKPGYFPSFILLPALATLLLAFIRMTIALRQARFIGEERILARTDELTGLPNRRRLISEIENFVGKNGTLLLMDLDGFKPVNDFHGHEMGDKVLQQVSMRFTRALPHNALLARLGGDEFGVLLEGSYESAMETALALRATLSYPFSIDNTAIELGVSIGLAQNDGSPDLLRRADDAMYRAKREGLGVCQL